MGHKKGFTLIELLIVIGILAVLATVTVLVLNPAQLFAQARDSQRMSDLKTVNDAILFTQANATVTLGTTPYTTGTTLTCNASTLSIYSTACTTNIVRTTGGAGWVGVDFSGVTPSPLAQLPIDPVLVSGVNGPTYFYTYRGTSGGLFRLGAVLESSKYVGLMTTDGGSATGMYEIGTSMSSTPLAP